MPIEQESFPNVRYARPEVLFELDKWRLIRDCLEGEKAIKAAGDIYLPRPNVEDKSQENLARYESYKKRAVFYNATRRTLDGLVGQVFLRDPVVEVPETISTIQEDADGSGVSLNEQAKKTLTDTVSFGRMGLFVDYPEVDGVLVTKAQQDSGYIKPTITLYQPDNITNWRTVKVGSRRLLSLVVLVEPFVTALDIFQPIFGIQWRVLRLTPIDSSVTEVDVLPPDTKLQYTVEIWRETDSSDGTAKLYRPFRTYFPRDSNGNTLSEIPFIFVGAINNDPDVDPAPLYDLAVLNVHHYQNSADYEESCYMVGQPTVYATGLTDQWVKDVMKGEFRIGSRAIIPLPVGGSAGKIQIDPNILPKEAMDQKEKQMVALGARLVEQKNVQQTLGEAQQKEAAQTSILASVARNVGAAYTRCLNWCMLFSGASGEVKFELNTDFISAQMTPEERAQLVAEWIDGAISRTELRFKLRKAGVATQNDQEAASEAEKDKLRLSSLTAKKASTVDQNAGKVAPTQNSKTQ